MPAALDLLTRGAAFISVAFGETVFSIEDHAGTFSGSWSDLGRTETLEVNGRRVQFQSVVQLLRSKFPDGVPPKHGKLVTRTSDGATFRIVGEIQTDALFVRFALESRHK